MNRHLNKPASTAAAVLGVCTIIAALAFATTSGPDGTYTTGDARVLAAFGIASGALLLAGAFFERKFNDVLAVIAIVIGAAAVPVALPFGWGIIAVAAATGLLAITAYAVKTMALSTTTATESTASTA